MCGRTPDAPFYPTAAPGGAGSKLALIHLPHTHAPGDHWKRAARFPSDEGCHAPDGPSSTLDPPGPPANPPPPGVPQSPALSPPHRPRQSQAPAQQDQIPLLLTQICLPYGQSNCSFPLPQPLPPAHPRPHPPGPSRSPRGPAPGQAQAQAPFGPGPRAC